MDVLFFWLYILEMKIVIKVVQTKGDTACKVVCNSMDNPYSGLPIGSLCGTGSWHWHMLQQLPLSHFCLMSPVPPWPTQLTPSGTVSNEV